MCGHCASVLLETLHYHKTVFLIKMTYLWSLYIFVAKTLCIILKLSTKWICIVPVYLDVETFYIKQKMYLINEMDLYGHHISWLPKLSVLS